MEWYQSPKYYVALAFIPPAVAIVLILLSEPSFFVGMISGISLFGIFPLTILMSYIWITGKGKRWINGYDFSKMTEEESRSVVSTLGMWMTFSMILMTIGVAMMPVNIFIGLTVIFLSVAVMVIGLVAGYSEKAKKKRLSMNPMKAMTIVALVTVVSIVPVIAMTTVNDTTESVDVFVGENTFTVKAPMFDHTFSYADIDSMEYYDEFEKGTRIMGYNTGYISSGKFKNDLLGNYELASYSEIAPCIVIKVNGDGYAFNQSSEQATKNLFAKLKDRMTP